MTFPAASSPAASNSPPPATQGGVDGYRQTRQTPARTLEVLVVTLGQNRVALDAAEISRVRPAADMVDASDTEGKERGIPAEDVHPLPARIGWVCDDPLAYLLQVGRESPVYLSVPRGVRLVSLPGDAQLPVPPFLRGTPTKLPVRGFLRWNNHVFCLLDVPHLLDLSPADR